MNQTDEIQVSPKSPHKRTLLFLIIALVSISAATGSVIYTLSRGPIWVPGDQPGSVSIGSQSSPWGGNLSFDNLTVPRDEILNGGPGKDGIPSLTEPETVPVRDAGFLRDKDRVIGLTINGESQAYPINLLNYHEIINDTLGDRPIGVLYCPLCDSVSIVDRRIDGETLAFGVSGLLYMSNVLLYDRSTQSLWSQIGFNAISGPYAGRSLEHLGGWELTTFGAWKENHPNSTVASFETGHTRRYNFNPYGDYFNQPEPMDHFARFIEPDDRLPPKARVIGLKIGDQTKAYPIERIAMAEGSIIRDQIGGEEVILSVPEGSGTARIDRIPQGALVVHTFWYAWAGLHPASTVLGDDRVVPSLDEESP